MLKPIVKRAVTATAGRLVAAASRVRAVVLCYHSIHPSLEIASVDPDLFRMHLEWLAEHCDVVPLGDVRGRAQSDENGSRPAVAITFDDGYEDNFSYAAPALSNAGMTATFFVTAGLVERDPDVLRRMEHLRRVDGTNMRAMSWDQIRELRRNGFTVGSHTYGHPNLARLTKAEAHADLDHAKRILETQLRGPVRQFAYPFGRPGRHFTAETVDVVRAVGHDIGASILYRGVRSSDTSLAIPRFFVEGDDVETLRAKVEGYWDPFGLWQQHASRGILPFVFDSSGRDYA